MTPLQIGLRIVGFVSLAAGVFLFFRGVESESPAESVTGIVLFFGGMWLMDHAEQVS